MGKVNCKCDAGLALLSSHLTAVGVYSNISAYIIEFQDRFLAISQGEGSSFMASSVRAVWPVRLPIFFPPFGLRLVMSFH